MGYNTPPEQTIIIRIIRDTGINFFKSKSNFYNKKKLAIINTYKKKKNIHHFEKQNEQNQNPHICLY